MKRVIVTAMLLTLAGTQLAHAQAGGICLFSDQSATQCSFTDNTPGLLAVYVVHVGTNGASAVEFSAPKPTCMVGASFLNDDVIFPVTIGDSQDQVAIGFGDCLSSPIHLLTINYVTSGTTAADCAYPVLPAAGMAAVNMVDCDLNLLEVTPGTAYINSNTACDCPVAPIPAILQVNKTTLPFGLTSTANNFFISNTGNGTLSWNIAESAPWLSLSPTSGLGDAIILGTIDRTGLAAGDYSANIDITSNGGNATVVATMSVPSTTPTLSFSPSSLTFAANEVTKNLSIVNSGLGVLQWSITSDQPWLTVNIASGNNNGNVGVSVNRTGLADGTYQGSLSITSNGGSGTVNVTMIIETPPAGLSVLPTSLTFTATQSSRTLTIANIGGEDLNWTITSNATWLSANPSSGLNGLVVSVDVDRTGLADGTHSSSLTVDSNGGSVTVPVMITVATQPILSLMPNTLTFSSSVFTRQFQIANVGVGQLQWSISDDQPWLLVQPPTSGTGNATLTAEVTQLPASGQQFAEITVTSNGGTETIDVIANAPPPSFAGILGVYADQAGVDCNIVDAAPGLLTVFVVHTNTSGATAVQFSAPQPACMTATYLSDTTPFAVSVGSTQTGRAVAYGGCLSGPIHVATISYFGQGTTPACCRYDVLPDPNSASGQIEVVDCASQLTTGLSAFGLVNPNGTCDCSASVKTEEHTWGSIKSIYAPDNPAIKRRQ